MKSEIKNERATFAEHSIQTLPFFFYVAIHNTVAITQIELPVISLISTPGTYLFGAL